MWNLSIWVKGYANSWFSFFFAGCVPTLALDGRHKCVYTIESVFGITKKYLFQMTECMLN